MRPNRQYFKADRLDRYEQLQLHPWYRRVIFEELTPSDRQYIQNFLRDTVHLTSEQYRIEVAYLFLDDPSRPENHILIQEVLSLL